jgi:two-component system sensor histidine kinase PhoQ
MKSISLRKRFFMNWTIVIVSVVILSALLVDIRYSQQLEISEQQKLKLHIFTLLSVTELNNGNISLPLLLANPSFNTPNSNLWAVVLDNYDRVLWRSLSIDNLPLKIPKSPDIGTWKYSKVSVNKQTYFTTSYSVKWTSGKDGASSNQDPIFHLIVAQRSNQFKSDILAFRIWLLLGSLAFVLTLLCVQYYVLKFSFKPINTLGEEIKRMESGGQSKLKASYPLELESVTNNLNLLIDKEHKQREKYRLAMADLAHSLKTPLSIISAEINHSADNDILRNALSRINETVEYQLRRSVISGHHLLAQETNVEMTLDMVLSALEKIHKDSGIKVTKTIDPDSAFMGDENDLLELFGNLIDNGFKYAKSQISISCMQTSTKLIIIVEDDGIGVPESETDNIFKRGNRLDESKQGQGIGLSIVENIVTSYDGNIQLKRSDLGGALFIINFNSTPQGASE